MTGVRIRTCLVVSSIALVLCPVLTQAEDGGSVSTVKLKELSGGRQRLAPRQSPEADGPVLMGVPGHNYAAPSMAGGFGPMSGGPLSGALPVPAGK